MKITVDRVKEKIRRKKFIDVRIDRLAHKSGFAKLPQKDLPLTGELRRSIGAGSNVELIQRENEGVEGPIIVEVGYGNQTIRIRLYRGYTLVRVWDLYTYWPTNRLDAFNRSFSLAVAKMIDEDETTRKNWREHHTS